MGTLLHFPDKRAATAHEGTVVVTVTGHGLAVGGSVLPWQAISEIWACRRDRPDERCLEFHCAGQVVLVGESHDAFVAVEAAAAAAFPSLRAWRESCDGGERRCVYRRAAPR